jgi:hypothetical protein
MTDSTLKRQYLFLHVFISIYIKYIIRFLGELDTNILTLVDSR